LHPRSLGGGENKRNADSIHSSNITPQLTRRELLSVADRDGQGKLTVIDGPRRSAIFFPSEELNFSKTFCPGRPFLKCGYPYAPSYPDPQNVALLAALQSMRANSGLLLKFMNPSS
jgi:hypothetical protein